MKLTTHLQSNVRDTGIYCSLLNESAETLYQGTGLPEYWIVILGVTQPALARQTAIDFLFSLADDYTYLRQRLELLRTATKAESMDIFNWMRARPEDHHLHMAVQALTRYCIGPKPFLLRDPIVHARAYLMSKGATKEQAQQEIYEFLHNAVSLETWKGGYV